MSIIIVALILLPAISTTAQAPRSMQYDNLASSAFTYTDDVVIEDLRSTNTYNFDGFVIFKSEQNNANSLNHLVIHLIHPNGTIAVTKRYEISSPNNHLVPVAAAYNRKTKQYIVTGMSRNITGTQQFETWYLLLDNDLNFLNMDVLLLNSSFIGANTNSTIVTDVCAVENNMGTDFAFLGTILQSNIDPKPIKVGMTQPFDRRMYIAMLDATNYTFNITEYDLSIAGMQIDRYYYPSRIIELPSQNDPGLFVTGTGLIYASVAVNQDGAKGFFYFRTDYSLNALDFVSLDEPNNGSNFYAGGNLFYDSKTDDIYVSGTVTTAGDNAFFFDMIQKVSTTPLINCFSLDVSNWNGQIGVKTLPASTVDGYPKSGWIAATASDGNRVAGRVCINTGASTVSLPVILSTTFNATDFNNWITAQPNVVHYYPRTLNTVTPVQFYLGQRYDQIWHPNHSSIEYLKGGTPTEEFGLTGLNNTSSGPKAVLNFIDVAYDNDCNYQHDNVGLDLWPVVSVGTIDVTPGTPSQTITTPSYNTPAVSIPNLVLCSNIPFKSAPGFENSFEKFQYNIYNDFGTLNMNCETADLTLKVVNMYGVVINSSNISNSKIEIDLQHYPVGIYFLSIFDKNNCKKVTVKFDVR